MNIFVDTDIFVALAKIDDTNHIRAQKMLEELLQTSVNFVTSNYVFTECVTIISQRVNHAAAFKFITAFKDKSLNTRNIWVNQTIETAAIEIFKKQTSKNTSLVDCTNMAIVKLHNLDAIFSFDEVYEKNDLHTVTNLLSTKR